MLSYCCCSTLREGHQTMTIRQDQFDAIAKRKRAPTDRSEALTHRHTTSMTADAVYTTQKATDSHQLNR